MHITFKKWAAGALLLLATTASAYSAPKSVLVVGDSLSAEYGLAHGEGWVALLEKKLAEQKIDAKLTNASISGDTSSGGRTRLAALLKQHKPDIVILELGANDGLRGLQLAATEANLRAMIEAAQASKAKVLLVGMRLPPNYGRDYTDRFFALFGKVAKDMHTGLVPFMLDGVGEKPELFQADRLHPLASAHPRILANIWPAFSLLLKAK